MNFALIGIHFFDALLWIFGPVMNYKARYLDNNRAMGSLELQNADVSWHLSINKGDIPGEDAMYRSIVVDDEEVDFTGGFTDLHNEVYKQIINGNGYGILDAMPAIELTHKLRGK